MLISTNFLTKSFQLQELENLLSCDNIYLLMLHTIWTDVCATHGLESCSYMYVGVKDIEIGRRGNGTSRCFLTALI